MLNRHEGKSEKGVWAGRRNLASVGEPVGCAPHTGPRRWAQLSAFSVQPSALLLVLVLAMTLPALGNVVYVDDDAPAGGDGSSWSKAYRFLQDGLKAAAAGDEIRVAQGVYKPDRSEAKPEGTGDRDATFEIPGGSLLGGYVGLSGADSNARDTALFKTVLSGDLAGNDLAHPVLAYFS